MVTRSEHLQIRLTPRQKATLKRRAAAACQDMSSYVVARTLPPAALRFDEIVRSLRNADDRRFALAELHDLLAELAPVEFTEAVARADLSRFSTCTRNLVAAMVEQAASQKKVAPPSWVASVPALEQPYFATPLKSLRLHLLKSSPVPFRKRNLFVDSTVGSRV